MINFFKYFSDLAKQIGQDKVLGKSWKLLLLSNAMCRRLNNGSSPHSTCRNADPLGSTINQSVT